MKVDARGGATILVAVLVAFTGCVGVPAAESGRESTLVAQKPIVIALIDSGLSPYPPMFAGHPSLSGVTVPYESVDWIREGTYDERVEADAALWHGIQPRTLYHFKDTRLFGMSFGSDSPDRRLIASDFANHGVVTSFLAARDAPGSIIVLLEVATTLCEPPPCDMPDVADAMEWIAQQDWIDVVSISLGFVGNTPDSGPAYPATARFVAASEAAAARGKIIVNGAGNAVVPPFASRANGPPWIITVGGAQIANHAEAFDAAKIIDLVANYTETGPAPWSVDEMATFHGTSVGTPVVAGTLAAALATIRANHGDPARIRDALNASAILFHADEWRPAPIDTEDPVGNVFDTSFPILVQPQQGWGYVNASLAPEIARRVIEQDFSIPAEKDQAMLFQPAWQQAREEYWAKMR